MASQWYVLKGDTKHGPYSSRQLKQLADQGKITPEEVISKGESGRTTKANNIRGLFGQAPEVPNLDTGPSEPASESESAPSIISSHKLTKHALLAAVGLIMLAVVIFAASAIWPNSQNSLISKTESSRSDEKALAPQNDTQKKADNDETVIKPRVVHSTEATPQNKNHLEEKSLSPEVISQPQGTDQIVLTQKIPLTEALFLTVGFVVIDPEKPEAEELDGVAGFIYLENLVKKHDYQLSRQTDITLGRGSLPGFDLVPSKEEWVNKDVKAVDCSNFAPLNLLYYLRDFEGDIYVNVNDTRYSIDEVWTQHLYGVFKEVLRQQQLKGYTNENSVENSTETDRNDSDKWTISQYDPLFNKMSLRNFREKYPNAESEIKQPEFRYEKWRCVVISEDGKKHYSAKHVTASFVENSMVSLAFTYKYILHRESVYEKLTNIKKLLGEPSSDSKTGRGLEDALVVYRWFETPKAGYAVLCTLKSKPLPDDEIAGSIYSLHVEIMNLAAMKKAAGRN